MARIASLHIYPVKSCRGIDLAAARIGTTGLEWDRRWMLVDRDSKFVSQRSHPLLATVATALDDDSLLLAANGHLPLRVSLAGDGPSRHVRIWDDDCRGIDCGDEAAHWFSTVASDALRLVRFDEAAPRLANPDFAGADQNVAFSDGYPLLVISTASLEDLNDRLPTPVPMGRFRPNIVIDGVAPYAEDSAAAFTSGAVRLLPAKACTRCITTTTDQLDGSRDPQGEPLKTLRSYRHDRELRGVAFGQNCVVAAGTGAELAVGAALDLEPHQV